MLHCSSWTIIPEVFVGLYDSTWSLYVFDERNRFSSVSYGSVLLAYVASLSRFPSAAALCL